MKCYIRKHFWFQVWDLNISDIFYKSQNFNGWLVSPVITYWTYTCLSPWALLLKIGTGCLGVHAPGGKCPCHTRKMIIMKIRGYAGSQGVCACPNHDTNQPQRSVQQLIYEALTDIVYKRHTTINFGISLRRSEIIHICFFWSPLDKNQVCTIINLESHIPHHLLYRNL